MLDNYYNYDVIVYIQTVDEYNDIRSTDSFITSCHYRDNNSVVSNSFNREEETADAMAWFRPGENVEQGYVITVDGHSFRVKKLIKARRLGDTNTQFLKCYLERFDSFVS